MPVTHIVAKGECLSRIARRYGFPNWRTIYDARENVEFRNKHPNPDLIYPGDILIIPDKNTKHVQLSAGSCHQLKLVGHTPLPAAIEFLFVHDEEPTEPFRGLEVNFQLPPSGIEAHAMTGPDGVIRFFAPQLAEGVVRVLSIRNRTTTPEQNFDRFGGEFETGVSHTLSLPADSMQAALPVVLKRTARRPGLEADGHPSADMMRGDYTTAQVLALSYMFQADDFIQDLDTVSASACFAALRRMATELFATGDLEQNIERMIDHFEANTGTDYCDPILTSTIRNHEQTKKLEQLVRDRLTSALEAKNGDISIITEHDIGIRDLDRPMFNGNSDNIRGLSIAVNDLQGFDVEVFEYKLTKHSYRGRFRISMFDHFGLDEPDVRKVFRFLPGFRAWFVLQHLQRFAYRPFITRVTLEYDFHGSVK